MPEAILYWIDKIMETFRNLSSNQAKHRIRSMTDLILFMVMDEKYNKLKIIPSITEFFSPEVTIDDNIEDQVMGFRGDFIG